MNTQEISREVVLVGGGHTHALVLRAWGMSPVAGARLTVINPAPTAPYTGMLPGHVAGHYRREELDIDLVRLAQAAGARLIIGMVTGIDLEAKRLKVTDRPEVTYDHLSIDIGITSDMPEIPGFSEHGVAAKPLGPFADLWARHISDDRGPVVVIGGGVAGVELALAMRHALGSTPDVTVIEAKSALAGLGKARVPLLNELQSAGITLLENSTVTAVAADHVTLSNGQPVPARFTVGAAGARPHAWLGKTGLPLTDGYITVDQSLRALGHADVYATGDCAHLSHAPRPKAGVFAVRAAPVLLHNLRADLIGAQRRAFHPQRDYLKLVSLGDNRALAIKWDRPLASGQWAWTWKDRIDQAFMNRLNAPAKMKAAAPKGHAVKRETVAPLCGGCGAKVSATSLDEVLPQQTRPGVSVGIGDDAAVLNVGTTRHAITTDHLRAFWNDPHLMACIAANHAMGDILAMGAVPRAALIQVTLPYLSVRLQSTWLADVMAGAERGLNGVPIVGGHTSMGAELQIGFTVTGQLDQDPLTIATAKPGDHLILTRPIGSGVLLSGLMQGTAHGDDIASLLATMGSDQSAVASVLAASANAMTDVTGFGLAGHLTRMAKASGLTAQISLADVPLLPGALDLATAGQRSTLWPSNRALHDGNSINDPAFDLLFDPQTAGGFLASIAPEASGDVLKRLRETGCDTARIGVFAARSDSPLKIN